MARGFLSVTCKIRHKVKKCIPTKARIKHFAINNGYTMNFFSSLLPCHSKLHMVSIKHPLRAITIGIHLRLLLLYNISDQLLRWLSTVFYIGRRLGLYSIDNGHISWPGKVQHLFLDRTFWKRSLISLISMLKLIDKS